MSERLWDPARHAEYLRQRDAVATRRSEEQAGVAAARNFEASWRTLGEDAQALLDLLARSGASACVGHCSDPLLARLTELGLLAWPPGVRPILTSDLMTSFHVPAAVRSVLCARLANAPQEPTGFERIAGELRDRFGARFALVPAAPSGAEDPAAGGR